MSSAQSPGLGTDTFVGRDRELAEVEALLVSAKDVQLRAALDGLPGIGKTELARQIIARLRGKHFLGGVFWFAAEHTDLRLQWAQIADDLGGPALPDLGDRAAWAVRQIELRAQRGEAVLIVLDNVETWSPPPSPLPDASGTRLLVTTRVRWLHNSFRPYEVKPLGLTPSRQLLEAIVGRELPEADELLRALGGHVLSIELAATYLREYGTTPADYLSQLMAGKSPASSVVDQTSYRATAESAFRLLWGRLSAELRTAWAVAAQLPPVWFSTELAEAIGLDAERRRGLVRLHILERDADGRHQMHRLLRELAQADDATTAAFGEKVTRVAAELLVCGDDVLTFQRYLRDAESFEHLLVTAGEAFGRFALIVGTGFALLQLGSLVEARVRLERALVLAIETYGDGHSMAASCRRSLATLLRHVGDFSAARLLVEQALASDLETFGEAHPYVAMDRKHLAAVLRGLGEVRGARVHLDQALAATVKLYGHDHPRAAIYRNELGNLLRELGELPAARVLLEQALGSGIKTYGDHHPTVASRRSDLARVFRDLGDLSTARVLVEQALAANLKCYGDDHLVVAADRNNLGTLLEELGELSAARVLLEQALVSDLKTYGDHHRSVATRRDNLAQVCRKLGDLSIARVLFEQALASDVKTYGEDHPVVATRRNNLGAVLHDLGEILSARMHYEQALASDLKTYGENHPQVAIGRNNLALLLRDLGELTGARVLLEQALASDLKTYGDGNPNVALVRANLAAVLRELEPPPG